MLPDRCRSRVKKPLVPSSTSPVPRETEGTSIGRMNRTCQTAFPATAVLHTGTAMKNASSMENTVVRQADRRELQSAFWKETEENT